MRRFEELVQNPVIAALQGERVSATILGCESRFPATVKQFAGTALGLPVAVLLLSV
jgi:hypothetical protein